MPGAVADTSRWHEWWRSPFAPEVDTLAEELLAEMRGMHLVAGTAATVMAVALWPQSYPLAVFGWLFAIWVCELVLEATSRGTFGSGADMPRRFRLYAFVHLIISACWGASVWLSLNEAEWQPLFLGALLFAISAGGQPPLSRHFPLYAAGTLLVLLPASSVLLFSSRFSVLVNGFGMLLFLAMLLLLRMSYMQWQQHREKVAAIARLAHLEKRLGHSNRQLLESKARLEGYGRRDPLTGIATLAALRNTLDAQLAQGGNERITLAAINLNGFRAINEAFGFFAGDHVLRILADRFVQIARSAQRVARISADEFVLYCGETGTEQLMSQITVALEQGVEWNDRRISLSARTGVAIAPRHGNDAGSLLESAMIAQEHCPPPTEDGCVIRVFEQDLGMDVRTRSSLRWAFIESVEREELSLHYQPQMSLKDGRIVGYEALMRWRSPEFGDVSPATFIPVAEQSGAILAAGRWAIGEAARAARAISRDHRLHVAVNVSVRQFADPAIVSDLLNAISACGLAQGQFHIEITENLLIADPVGVRNRLEAIRGAGIKVGLDDFGSGFSSLGYLRDIPLDYLKLDRLFVQALPVDGRQAAIVESIIDMAHALEIGVVAEGVERQEQLEWLRMAGCDLAQGYHVGRAMPLDATPGEEVSVPS